MSRRTSTDETGRRWLGFLTAALLVAIGALAVAGSGVAAPPASTDLGITKTDSPDPVRVGSTLTYTIGVENHGPLAASGVTVSDALPKGVDFLAASSSAGSCAQQNRKVTCALGSVPFGVNYGAPPTVTIAVVPRQVGTLTNTATVKATQKDPVAADNSATATTQVLGAPTCRGVAATVVGTPGDDVLTGTSGPDVVVAFGGSDTIRTGAGRDLICAGAGNDSVVAGSAADRIFGGAGRDHLLGRGGPDLIKAGAGNDVLAGGRGDDRLRGGSGFDRCTGGPGRNSIRSCER